MRAIIIFKCKMCGGDVLAQDGALTGVCDSCGTASAMPRIPDERRVNLFNRANHFRRHSEFDKALETYEALLNEDNGDAEAHWCAVLCRYGIEYVEDPVTRERIPTCHRVQYASVLSDADYQAALEYAPDVYTRGLYEAEAAKISALQRDILAISGREEGYDVFICYKETSDGGSRTRDSVLAQDIYYQLTGSGLRVFFSRVTLEDKLGRQYEPYIFGALNSAKVMLVIGTRKEHFEAVWVRNEWSRYLRLLRADRSRLLIPCYRDMDAYDLPEELSGLQALDMGKIGFMQDLQHGIKKVLGTEPQRPAGAAAVDDERVAEICRKIRAQMPNIKKGQAAAEQEIIYGLLPELMTYRNKAVSEEGKNQIRRIAAMRAPENGATLLHLAAHYEDAEAVKFLVAMGADVNARQGAAERWTPLDNLMQPNKNIGSSPEAVREIRAFLEENGGTGGNKPAYGPLVGGLTLPPEFGPSPSYEPPEYGPDVPRYGPGIQNGPGVPQYGPGGPQYGVQQYAGYETGLQYIGDPVHPVKSKVTAGLLAIFLGSFGVHEFYLGKIGLGVLMLLFCWTYIPALIGLIQGIVYLCMSGENFARKFKCRVKN